MGNIARDSGTGWGGARERERERFIRDGCVMTESEREKIKGGVWHRNEIQRQMESRNR